MKNKFLGIICILYSIIITYVCISDKLKNFLAPQLQIYIKLTIIPLIIIGIVLFSTPNHHSKFKINDLILLLPIIIIILAGDSKLTITFAKNRVNNYDSKKPVKVEKKKEKEASEPIDSKEEINLENINQYDIENPYFDIVDSNYNELSNYITFEEKAENYVGKTIRVRGFVVKKLSYVPDGYFAIGKYAISCCAADAGFTGFVVKNSNNKVYTSDWCEIVGVLSKVKTSKKNNLIYIEPIKITKIDSKKEEQYVYPCYSYDDGDCKNFTKYNLEY